MEEEFKLVGILNIFELSNEFVYPIFEFEGKYYLQSNDSLNKIESFELVASTFNKLVKPIDAYELHYSGNKMIFKIGDDALYGIEFTDSKVFLGTFKELKTLVKTTTFDDQYLAIEAPYFIKSTEKKILEMKKADN